MLKVRAARASDACQLITLFEEHAEFEGQILPPDPYLAERLGSWIQNRSDDRWCWVVEKEGRLYGYATCLVQFNSWKAQSYLYLDCLYLRQSARGLGLGKLLLQEVANQAKGMKIKEVQWQTPMTNESAKSFYQKMGASYLSKARFFWSPGC